MKTAIIVILALATASCVNPDCDEASLHDEGYSLGEQCIDWITAWDDDDGQCAADALARGYNEARADSGIDCNQSPSVGGVGGDMLDRVR